MQSSQVQKSAQQPASADTALDEAAASLRVIDVAVDAAEFPEHANPQLKIALILDATALEVGWQSATGRAMQGRVACGTTSVMPAQMHYTTRWRGAGRMLLLSFSPEFLNVAKAEGGPAAEALPPMWSQSDPLLVQLGLSVLAAQRAALATQSYLDAAAEVAMVHLLHRYGAVRPPAAPVLVPARMARVLDLIESSLDEDLSLARMAEAAGLSVSGFARAFANAVGESPHRYLLKRRIERARELLAHGSAPIAEITAALGFSSQAHLTTAFLRQTGTTPARYRAQSRSGGAGGKLQPPPTRSKP